MGLTLHFSEGHRNTLRIKVQFSQKPLHMCTEAAGEKKMHFLKLKKNTSVMQYDSRDEYEAGT